MLSRVSSVAVQAVRPSAARAISVSATTLKTAEPNTPARSSRNPYAFRTELWQPSLNPRATRHRHRLGGVWDRWSAEPEVVDFPSLRTTLSQHAESSLSSKDALAQTHANEKLAWDYGELQDWTWMVAHGMGEVDMHNGQRVLTWAGNDVEAAMSALAAGHVTSHCVALDPEATVDQLKEALDEHQPRSLVYTPYWNGVWRRDVIHKEVVAITPPEWEVYEVGDRTRVTLSKRWRNLRWVYNILYEPGYADDLYWGQGKVDYPKKHEDGEDNVAHNVHALKGYATPQDPTFTSVRVVKDALVTGHTFSMADCIQAADKSADAVGLGSADSVLLAAPLHTAFCTVGGFYSALRVGAKSVFVNRQWRADQAVDALAKQRCTVVRATGQQLKEMEAAAGTTEFPRLRAVVADTTQGPAPETFCGIKVQTVDTTDDSVLL